MSPLYAVVTILVIAVATLATRALPFLLFPAGKETPPYILYLGKALPCATIGMLVIYCLREVAPLEWPFGLPEMIATATVAIAQYVKRNTLLSIAAGTFFYMVLVQFVF